jgi:hypothetical protein
MTTDGHKTFFEWSPDEQLASDCAIGLEEWLERQHRVSSRMGARASVVAPRRELATA